SPPDLIRRRKQRSDSGNQISVWNGKTVLPRRKPARSISSNQSPTGGWRFPPSCATAVRSKPFLFFQARWPYNWPTGFFNMEGFTSDLALFSGSFLDSLQKTTK